MAISEQNAIFAPTTVFAPADRLRDRTYLAWATVATAYAIAFLQRVSPQSVSLSFMQDFGTDAAGVAMLASSYFWGYTLMQIPAGLLVDRYGVKLVVLSFTDERFGVMSGISQVSGYVGGVMATTPLAAAVTGFGWRACFVFIACVGVANLAFASLALKPDPASRSAKTLGGVLAASRQSLSQIANWGCAMTFASHFAVVTTLSGVWGIPMVAHFFDMSPSAASTPLLAFMVGNAIGSIFLGHMADRAAAALDTALVRICVLRMILIAMLLPPFAHALGFLYVTVIFAALGLVAGGTVPLVLKCTKRLYTSDLIGVGASVNTTAAGIFAGASQPIIGFAMVGVSQLAGTDIEQGPGSVGDAGYGALIGILLLMSLPGIAGPLLMRSKLIVGK